MVNISDGTSQDSRPLRPLCHQPAALGIRETQVSARVGEEWPSIC